MELALVLCIVGLAAGWLVWRSLRKPKVSVPGCGGCAGCGAPPPEGCDGPKPPGSSDLIYFDTPPRRNP